MPTDHSLPEAAGASHQLRIAGYTIHEIASKHILLGCRNEILGIAITPLDATTGADGMVATATWGRRRDIFWDRAIVSHSGLPGDTEFCNRFIIIDRLGLLERHFGVYWVPSII